jgi:HSP20 family protein
MGLIRWNPWQELESFNHRLNHLLDDSADDDVKKFNGWLPNVDVHETENEFVVSADLPGMDKKDVKVEVANGALIISGERKSEVEQDNENMHRVERSFGCFIRSFSLPPNVDGSKVNAKMENGVLKVEIAKKEGAETKSITVE